MAETARALGSRGQQADGGLTAGADCCPLCGGADLRIYIDSPEHSLDPDAFGSSRRQFAHGLILQCRGCRFTFSRLRPSADELAGLYRTMDVAVYASETSGRARTAARHLRIVSRFSRTGALLDVGCASGMFLQQAAAEGWTVTGIEPSSRLCREAEETLDGTGQVLCTTLEAARLHPSSFDAVTLWDVLEHVPDPVGALRQCRELLRPGGHVFVNVPDIGSLQARVLGRRWPLLLPEHLNYFSRSTLGLCASRASLKPVHFGSRPVSFSLGYVTYRLSQHALPGMRLATVALSQTGLSGAVFPVWMGETYAVLRRES